MSLIPPDTQEVQDLLTITSLHNHTNSNTRKAHKAITPFQLLHDIMITLPLSHQSATPVNASNPPTYNECFYSHTIYHSSEEPKPPSPPNPKKKPLLFLPPPLSIKRLQRIRLLRLRNPALTLEPILHASLPDTILPPIILAEPDEADLALDLRLAAGRKQVLGDMLEVGLLAGGAGLAVVAEVQ